MTEGIKMAQKALQTVDTDVSVPAGTHATASRRVQSFGLTLAAHTPSMGTIEYNQNNFPAARRRLPEGDRRCPQRPLCPRRAPPRPLAATSRENTGGPQGGQPRRRYDAGQHAHGNSGAPRA